MSRLNGYKHTKKTIEKISLALKGHVVSQETRDKIGNANRGKCVGKKNGMYGVKPWNYNMAMSREFKDKVSMAKKEWFENRKITNLHIV